eukprot:GHVT01043845.1.p2 GENE.GHVT01043845.1~~GHVT01043845.1.p2  ORF type:complete len:500 (+),score=84.88 GHVT01043845.1:2793-4292(+)
MGYEDVAGRAEQAEARRVQAEKLEHGRRRKASLASRVQSFFRGWRDRRTAHRQQIVAAAEEVRRVTNVLRIQGWWRRQLAERKLRLLRQQRQAVQIIAKHHRFLAAIQHVRMHRRTDAAIEFIRLADCLERNASATHVAWAVARLLQFGHAAAAAALLIQRCWRGVACRRWWWCGGGRSTTSNRAALGRAASSIETVAAIIKLQARVRGKRERVRLRALHGQLPCERNERLAATKLQAYMRGRRVRLLLAAARSASARASSAEIDFDLSALDEVLAGLGALEDQQHAAGASLSLTSSQHGSGLLAVNFVPLVNTTTDGGFTNCSAGHLDSRQAVPTQADARSILAAAEEMHKVLFGPPPLDGPVRELSPANATQPPRLRTPAQPAEGSTKVNPRTHAAVNPEKGETVVEPPRSTISSHQPQGGTVQRSGSAELTSRVPSDLRKLNRKLTAPWPPPMPRRPGASRGNRRDSNRGRGPLPRKAQDVIAEWKRQQEAAENAT